MAKICKKYMNTFKCCPKFFWFHVFCESVPNVCINKYENHSKLELKLIEITFTNENNEMPLITYI